MRIALFGTGSIGRRHLRTLHALVDPVEFVFVRANGRRDQTADDYDARVVSDAAQAIDAGLDLAVIATPSHLHAAPLEALLRAGVPTYIEKPVVTTRDDVQRIEALVASLKSPPPTLCGCNLRFLPSLQRLREELVTGRAGRIVRAHLQAGQWLPDWRPSQDYRASYSASRDGGGVVFDLVHEIDMARWLFGEFDGESDVVLAAGGRYSGLDIASEDAAGLVLARRQGPVVTIGLDYVARVPIRRYEVFGDAATLTWDLPARTLHRAAPASHELLDGDAANFDVPRTYETAMETLLDAVRGGPSPAQDVGEGLRSARLALDAVDRLRA